MSLERVVGCFVKYTTKGEVRVTLWIGCGVKVECLVVVGTCGVTSWYGWVWMECGMREGRWFRGLLEVCGRECGLRGWV